MKTFIVQLKNGTIILEEFIGIEPRHEEFSNDEESTAYETAWHDWNTKRKCILSLHTDPKDKIYWQSIINSKVTIEDINIFGDLAVLTTTKIIDIKLTALQILSGMNDNDFFDVLHQYVDKQKKING